MSDVFNFFSNEKWCKETMQKYFSSREISIFNYFNIIISKLMILKIFSFFNTDYLDGRLSSRISFMFNVFKLYISLFNYYCIFTFENAK